MSILSELEDQKIEQVARELGTEMTRDFTLLVFKRMNVETYLASLSVLSKYSGLAKYEIESDGRSYVMTAHHDLGKKWSVRLKAFITEGMKQSIGTLPQFEIGEKSLVFRFKVA